MKSIYAVFMIALLTLTLFRCKEDHDPPTKYKAVFHSFGVTNVRAWNGIHYYDKTFNMLTILSTDPSGSMMTLTFKEPVPLDSSKTVGLLQLPNDGYYTIKVYATDGSYVKWDNYYMVRNGRTGFAISLFPDCKNWGSTTGYMSTATEYYFKPKSQRNTGYHIVDGSSWCDSNP
ncbi:MAG: hypothetical protein M1391_05605 [Bacteroidetes bacterium]|nr:hypothetical protein [Bacteroidota bacterium]